MTPSTANRCANFAQTIGRAVKQAASGAVLQALTWSLNFPLATSGVDCDAVRAHGGAITELGARIFKAALAYRRLEC